MIMIVPSLSQVLTVIVNADRGINHGNAVEVMGLVG
jgi:hypothetical protein